MEELRRTHFTIIGAGSLGSFTATLLAHMGAEQITIFDHDKVEEHNLPVQFLNPKYLGEYKVQALKEQMKEWYDINITAKPQKFDSLSPVSAIVISAVDSMKVRGEIWESIKLQPSVKLYIDTRAGGLTAALYSTEPNNLDQIEKYEKTLGAEDAVDLPCTEQMTTHIASSVGSLVCNIVNKFLGGDKGKIPQALTFNADLLVFLGTQSFFTGCRENRQTENGQIADPLAVSPPAPGYTEHEEEYEEDNFPYDAGYDEDYDEDNDEDYAR